MDTAKLTAREIKKFAKYGLIKTTNHSKERFDQRNFTAKEILTSLKTDCIIRRSRKTDTGYVYEALSKGITVIIAKDINAETDGITYQIVTAYIQD